MLNYEHETKNIRDRYLKYYLFYDYFHDSIIHSINICGECVIFNLSCEREWPESEREKYMFDAKYLYKLTFEECRHIEWQYNRGNFIEFINGRFKKTAKLIRINAESRKKYYHLRIQLSGGFLDLIFSKFAIEKQESEVKLPARFETRWYFDWVLKKFSNNSIDEIREIAEHGEFPIKACALEYLWRVQDNKCYDLAIKALNDEDSWIGAAFILGEVGSFDVVPLLINLLRKFECDSIVRRHITDAIEKIILRTESSEVFNRCLSQ